MWIVRPGSSAPPSYASTERRAGLLALTAALWGCGHPASAGSTAAPATAVDRPSEADGPLTLQMVNLDEVSFPAQEPDTPPTMRIATLEGVFPFGPQESYTALIEFDPGVEVPVHQHPTTERVSILAGDIQFGTGPESDRTKAKALAPGAVIITPAGTPHWGFIAGAKALLYIHGVGPHNDPRAVDPAAAAPAAPRFDPRLAAPVILNAAEVRFAPAPAPFPAGSSIAVLEGDPFHSPAELTLQLRLPAGARWAPHTHPTHERMVVLSGSVTVSAGRVSKEIKAGGFVLMPAGRRHTLATTAGAVLQIQGPGPYRIDPAVAR